MNLKGFFWFDFLATRVRETIKCSYLLTFAILLMLLSGLISPLSAEDISELRQRQLAIEAQRDLYREKKLLALRQVRAVNDQIVRNQSKMEAAQSAVISSQVKLSLLEQRIKVIENHLELLQQKKIHLERQFYRRGRTLGTPLWWQDMFLLIDSLNTLLASQCCWDQTTWHDKYSLDHWRDITREIATQQQELGYSRSMRINEITRISSLQRQISVRIRSDWSLKTRYMKDVNTYERAENELARESRNIELQILRQLYR